MNTQDALTTLNDYLAAHGSNESSSLESWDVSPYNDAFVFSHKGVRSNRLYIVKGITVNSFSPATTSLEEAYRQLDSQHNIHPDTLDVAVKEVGVKLISMSSYLDDHMQKWSEVSERPNKLDPTECIGFINKPTANTDDINIIVDVQAPEISNDAKLRLWASKSQKDADGNELFNNIQMDFSVNYNSARAITIKSKDATRDDIQAILQDKDTQLDRLILSSQSSIDTDTGQPTGIRLDLLREAVSDTMRDQSSGDVIPTDKINYILLNILPIVDPRQ